MFVCSRCGSFGCPECVFSAVKKREVCQSCAGAGLGEVIPWERRKEIGNWDAFWRTCTLSLRQPTRFFKTPSTHEGVGAAVGHGVLTYTFGMLLTYLVTGLLIMLGGGAAALVGGDQMQIVGGLLGFYGCVFAGMSPLALLFGPANALLGLVFATACSHGTLALFGKTKGSFEDTLRALSYTNASRIWFVVPIIGAFAWFWMVGVEVIALRETHECGSDWAAAAALGYRVIFTVVVVAVYAVIFGAFFMMEAQRMGSM